MSDTRLHCGFTAASLLTCFSGWPCGLSCTCFASIYLRLVCEQLLERRSAGNVHGNKRSDERVKDWMSRDHSSLCFASDRLGPGNDSGERGEGRTVW